MSYAINPISHVVREMHYWLTFAIFCGANISGNLFSVASPNDVIIHQLFRNARVAYPKAARQCLATISETITKTGSDGDKQRK